MSRDCNNLQRHIADCLVDRREMFDWIRRAQALSPWIQVTESDWARYGDVPIERWLMDRKLDEPDPRDDWQDWGDETFDAPELDEWDDWPQHEHESQSYSDEYWEPQDLEYGGRYYPTAHVEHARGLQAT